MIWKKSNPTAKMQLIEHLFELRRHIIVCCIFLLVNSGICYYYSDGIFDILVRPLKEIFVQMHIQRKLIYTNLLEAFLLKIKIALWGGALLTFPIFIWQTYKFMAPALYKRERKAIWPYLLLAPVLFILGVILVYYYIVPNAWRFLLSFEHNLSYSIPVILEARISEYLSLMMSLIISFGIAFQFPLILVLLVHIRLININTLIYFRRHAIVLIFLGAAILTPPDVLSQVALAVPLVMLYELSIIICKYFILRK